MITPKDLENKTMSPEKRKSAKNDYFAFYVGRPLSYILTIPFFVTALLAVFVQHGIQGRSDIPCRPGQTVAQKLKTI